MSHLDDRKNDMFGLEAWENDEVLQIVRLVRARARDLIEGPISRMEPMHISSPIDYFERLQDLKLEIEREMREAWRLASSARNLTRKAVTS